MAKPAVIFRPVSFCLTAHKPKPTGLNTENNAKENDARQGGSDG